MNISEYMNEKFPNVELVPHIYYQWVIGIHFSLGKGIYQFKENDALNLERFSTGNKQVVTLFEELFEQNDDLFLVTNLYKQKAQRQTSKLKVYQRNLKNKNKLKDLRVKTYSYPFEVDNREEYEMQQISLRCKLSDLRVSRLLKGALHEDFPLRPKFGENFVHYPDVFFVNATKDVVFFMYDDRGCEVIARTADRLCPLYENYYDWVEEIDRERIETGLGM